MNPTSSGKVRELFDAGDSLVLVASDRISAFDVVLPSLIPDKGKILSTLSVFWFARTSHIVDNHLLLHRVADFPEPMRSFGLEDDWDGRAMLCRKARVLPVECVVRGYLSGSGWASYQRSGEVCGVRLPANLRESDKLPSPIFTPTTKAPIGGHDEPITWEQTVAILGDDQARAVREASLALYEWVSNFAAERGLILADTKFEFGVADGDLLVVDEMATPDSSRFWDAQTYEPGRPQNSFDKQFVRDYLLGLEWDKTAPGPNLPPEVIDNTRTKYVEAFDRLTGLQWPDRDVRPHRKV